MRVTDPRCPLTMTHHDTSVLPPTTLDVSDLIDAPGESREVHVRAPVPSGFEIPLTVFGEAIVVVGVLESLVDGILLRGEISVHVQQQCVACLEQANDHQVTIDVAELFTDPADADDDDEVDTGYEISDGTLDIEIAVRDALAVGVSRSPHCREDCAGLCPSCGINRNRLTCSCDADDFDDRWAALADLKLDN